MFTCALAQWLGNPEVAASNRGLVLFSIYFFLTLLFNLFISEKREIQVFSTKISIFLIN